MRIIEKQRTLLSVPGKGCAVWFLHFARIPISFKNDKLEETTLFDAEKGGFPQTPIREKAKIYLGIHDAFSGIAIDWRIV